ncbi:MAG TPA: prolipoprotein diacylglyceryl transferase family protein, partial [Propionibacteriaceae bacterium]|nr:prolipoprotein diacylglyceryl transferase family protein [Propionibacteriaceae bacterium]
MTSFATPLSIPSPPWSQFHIGPLTIHFYALCILTGIIVAWIMTRRRYVARGGDGEQFENIAAVSVVLGIIGARLYHITSDYELYFVPGKDPW